MIATFRNVKFHRLITTKVLKGYIIRLLLIDVDRLIWRFITAFSCFYRLDRESMSITQNDCNIFNTIMSWIHVGKHVVVIDDLRSNLTLDHKIVFISYGISLEPSQRIIDFIYNRIRIRVQGTWSKNRNTQHKRKQLLCNCVFYWYVLTALLKEVNNAGCSL